jgi:hypothetical protein
MATQIKRHAYVDTPAFERLMVLIATLVQYPGIGAADGAESQEQEHDAMKPIVGQMQQVAEALGIGLPTYSVHTLRKDLRTLRQYGILERRMYRWGYYLGTGVMTRTELQLALQLLLSQAQHQGDFQAKQVYQAIARRLKGLNLELNGQLLYPVRTQLSRAIVHTDPEEMMRLGNYRQTLFHQLQAVEQAIVQGQGLEVYQRRDPYGTTGVGALQIYPLQLIYADIAWYLLYETIATGHLAVERVDRFSEELQVIQPVREIATQQNSLKQAHQLLMNGWGLYLGNSDEQQQERSGQLDLVQVVVRFFPPVTAFILEGERRHPRQAIRQGAGAFVDYSIELPPRSLNEFCWWVYRFMHCAQILAPAELVEKHRQSAVQVVQRYE